MENRDFHGYTIYENGNIEGLYGKTLKQRTREGGRKEIRMTVKGERKNFIVSRLVYCVFNDIDIFELDKDQCVVAIDGDKSNVTLNNLELVYRGDLIQGEKHTAISKLTDEQIEEIRAKYESTKDNRPVNQYDVEGTYHSYRSLAEEYSVTYTMIKHIIKGDSRDSSKYKLKEK